MSVGNQRANGSVTVVPWLSIREGVVYDTGRHVAVGAVVPSSHPVPCGGIGDAFQPS